MRRILLSLAVLATAAAAQADDLKFGYAIGDYVAGVGGNQAGYYYGAAIKLPGQLQLAYGEGAKITALSIGFGSSPTTNAQVFVTKTLGGTALTTQDATMTTNSGQNEVGVYTTVTLDNPVTLDGTDLYLGYTTAGLTGTGNYPLGFDNSGIAVPGVSFIALNNKPVTEYAEDQRFGNLAIRAVITTADGVENFVFPMVAGNVGYSKPGEVFEGQVLIQNLGSNDVTSLKVNTKIGDAEVISEEITLDLALGAGLCGIIPVSNLKTDNLGKGQKIIYDVTGVNGGVNAYPTAVAESSIDIIEDYFVRTCVIEEGTGTGCGFCPRGYLGMEYMREHYTDGSYIGIAAHTYNNNDPMYCSTYLSAMNTYVAGKLGGYPSAGANRMYVFDPSIDNCEAYYSVIQSEYATEKVDIRNVRYSDGEYKGLYVFCDVTSLEGMNGHKLGLALVTTEDGVGPYAQSNYFAGGKYGEMGGFESKAAYVNLTFNDVARQIVSWNGNTSVIPQTLPKGEAVEATMMEIPTTAIQKLENAFVVALLIDTTDGRIVNAARVKLPEAIPGNVSVSDVAADFDGEAEYYTLDGIRVSSDALAPGLYIVRTGSTATKILVK